MAKAKQENPLFVGITSGEDLRRELLGCSKDILESLKDFERFKSKKQERINLMHQFKEDVKGISKLINQVKSALPNVKDLPKSKNITIEEPKKESPKHIKVEKPKHRTELDRLESELNDIESKLNSMS